MRKLTRAHKSKSKSKSTGLKSKSIIHPKPPRGIDELILETLNLMDLNQKLWKIRNRNRSCSDCLLYEYCIGDEDIGDTCRRFVDRSKEETG